MRFRFWASAFYFAFYAAGGSFGPFLTAYYRGVGIPVEQIGILAALPLLTMLVGNPLWSLVADTFHLHSRLLPIVMLLTLPFAWLLTRADTFWPLAVLAMLYAFCLSPIISMGDYAVLQALGEQRYDYGKVRIWGAVGYGLSAWYGGALIERIGLQHSVFTFLIMMAFGAFVATRLPAPRPQASSHQASPPFFARFRALSRDSRWYGFLAGTLMAGLGFVTINSFFVLYLKDLGAGEGLYGFSIALAGISELPIFFFSAYLIRRWSPRGLLAIAIAVLVVRLLLNSLVRNPGLIILVQLLHGLSFSALWAAGVNYANEIAPPGLGASAQALFGMMLFGLSGALGASIGGRVYGAWGGAALFQVAAGAVFIGWVMFLSIRGKPAPLTPA